MSAAVPKKPTKWRGHALKCPNTPPQTRGSSSEQVLLDHRWLKLAGSILHTSANEAEESRQRAQKTCNDVYELCGVRAKKQGGRQEEEKGRDQAANIKTAAPERANQPA